MTPGPTVEIALDLREMARPVRGFEDVAALLENLAQAMDGRSLRPDRMLSFEAPELGRVAVTVLAVPPGLEAVGPATPFAVHALLERPTPRPSCAVCAAEKRPRFGPHRCVESLVPLCDEHAVILDGGLDAFAPGRVPRSPETGEQATFWCPGPRCRNRVPWGDAQRVPHPNDPEVALCPECFGELFPRCDHPGCVDTGSMACEHFDAGSGRPCNRKLCSRHGQRWQVYGPHRLGLERCPEHARIDRLSDAEVAFQIAAGTALRLLDRDARGRSARFKDPYSLPSLRSVKHILLHTRNRKYELDAIRGLFAQIAPRPGAQEPDGAIAWLIGEKHPWWDQELREGVASDREGRDLFAKIVAELEAMDLDEVAEGLRFSDYKPAKKLMFVYLSEDLRGLFIGRGGATIKQIQAEFGVKINFERGES